MAEREGLDRRIRERLEEQRGLVLDLLDAKAQLPGSLFERWAECRKPGCSCRTGNKHGPYWVLSLRSGGRGQYSYIDPDRAEEVRRLVDAHRRFRDGVKKLRRLSEELLELLDSYRSGVAKQTGERFGIGA